MTIKKTINVSVVKKTNLGTINPTNPVTLKNVPTIASGVTRLDSLRDVNPTGETDGAVPVYQAATDTYIVKQVDLGTDVSGNLDGGTF